MASIRKIGSVWRVEVVKKIGGVKVRRSTTKDTKAEAYSWGVQTEAALESGERPSSKGAGVTLHHVLECYKEEGAPLRPGARWERTRCGKFIRELGFVGSKLESISSKDIAAWRNNALKSGLSPSTVNREMNLLSTIFEFARHEKGWISYNPVRGVKRLKNPDHRDRLVYPDERVKILEQLGYIEGTIPTLKKHYAALAFLFALETGARAGEILKLRWKFVDYERRVARITNGTKNGDRWRDLPLFDEAIQILKLCEAGRVENEEMCFPVSSSSLDALFRKARDKAKIVDLTFHDARHQAATTMAAVRKLTPYQLALVLGHRTLKHVMIYYNEDIHEIAMKGNFGSSGGFESARA